MATPSETARRAVGAFGTWVENWFIPPVCVHCGARRFGDGPLCFRCLRVLLAGSLSPVNFLPGGGGTALYRMTPPLQSLIHGFKYRSFRRHIRFLFRGLRRHPTLLAALGRFDAVVPVPLHPARRRERGYNQAELIALEIAGRCGNPVIPGGLARIRRTLSQTRLGEEERAHNLSGAFRADPEMVRGRKILLVDDVCTTGSTLRHCREELSRAGAAGVETFTLAWVERMHPESRGVRRRNF